MSEYTPKVGHRVRAKLGENVLVGVFEYVDRLAAEIRVNGSLFSLFLPDGWQFEQFVEVPSKPWALVGHPTDYDYVPYIRDRSGNWHEIDSDGQTLRVDEETVMHYMTRGFTVLFEGVGE